MLAHHYASRDNSRGLVKNYERGIKMKPSKKPGVQQRLVLWEKCQPNCHHQAQSCWVEGRGAERGCRLFSVYHSTSCILPPKQSNLSIYHPFRYGASYLNSSIQESTAVVSWMEARLVKVKRKRLVQGQRKVCAYQFRDLKIWQGWWGFLSSHLSPALSRSKEKSRWTSICHYIMVAPLVTTD